MPVFLRGYWCRVRSFAVKSAKPTAPVGERRERARFMVSSTVSRVVELTSSMKAPDSFHESKL